MLSCFPGRREGENSYFPLMHLYPVPTFHEYLLSALFPTCRAASHRCALARCRGARLQRARTRALVRPARGPAAVRRALLRHAPRLRRRRRRRVLCRRRRRRVARSLAARLRGRRRPRRQPQLARRGSLLPHAVVGCVYCLINCQR